ncbi:hypothetical protein C8J57DRAFT_1516995 [Mycena rebaudengoi]|nr:hypothetical protein C8J57DRAFT_1516995 [Mycena rebaudengoi]
MDHVLRLRQLHQVILNTFSAQRTPPAPGRPRAVALPSVGSLLSSDSVSRAHAAPIEGARSRQSTPLNLLHSRSRRLMPEFLRWVARGLREGAAGVHASFAPLRSTTPSDLNIAPHGLRPWLRSSAHLPRIYGLYSVPPSHKPAALAFPVCTAAAGRFAVYCMRPGEEMPLPHSLIVRIRAAHASASPPTSAFHGGTTSTSTSPAFRSPASP